MTVAISRPVDRIGQVLGGRYRLIAPIGTGASASVYLADDVTLRRRVAVKILHDALAEDAAFLKRFRAEAQAAAALNHPHIMAVYDWGHGDVPYLVTEFLGGGSLRAMLDLGRRLDPAQALMVGLEAARGLAYAHRRGFVHRDIKPANLLFDDEGRLRIADFGLARALAEAAWTEPMGAVLGTARYASPEQARGATLDGRSDVYSLALVLIEAVTGQVPFSADTTIGTLMGRVDQHLPVPPALGPLVPALEEAGRPDPADRPDAEAFAEALMTAAPQLDPPAPLPLAGAMAPGLDEFEDRDPTTRYVPEREAVADLEPVIMLAPPGTTSDGLTILHEGDGQPETRVVDRGPVPGPAAPRRRRWPRVLAVLVLLAALGAGAWGWWYTQIRIPTVAVPELVGRPLEEVEATLAANGWVAERLETRADGTVAGEVIAQDPPPGTHLAAGDVVRLTVSLGPPLVDVAREVTGRPLEEVIFINGLVGLNVAVVEERFDEEAPAGTVLALAPDVPAQLPKGDAVPVVVSKGPEPRTVPGDLVGGSRGSAVAALEALRLDVAVAEEFSESVPAGVVMAVAPGEGTRVPRGATVTLTVSKGPPLVSVPSVAGLSAADAATRLEAAGLVVSSTRGSPANKVTGTDPAAGTQVRRGTSVVIITA